MVTSKLENGGILGIMSCMNIQHLLRTITIGPLIQPFTTTEWNVMIVVLEYLLETSGKFMCVKLHFMQSWELSIHPWDIV